MNAVIFFTITKYVNAYLLNDVNQLLVYEKERRLFPYRILHIRFPFTKNIKIICGILSLKKIYPVKKNHRQVKKKDTVVLTNMAVKKRDEYLRQVL